jgi:hypothetical protein
MSHEVFYQFPQTAGQARRVGARGGKATARNRRERLDGAAAEITEPLASEAEPQVPLETAAAASALLDAQYPWLRGAERRPPTRAPSRRV